MSPTKKISRIRKRKKSIMGKKRKASLRTKGSTRSRRELFGD